MQGVNSLQDLKNKLALSGFEIYESLGWYIDTAHGRWTMAHGVVYIENIPVKNIADVPIKKKPAKKIPSGRIVKKIKSARK